MQLFVQRTLPLGGLLLEGVQQAELALAGDHVDHPVGAERADQLVLQVAVADEEAEPFERRRVR